MVHTGGGNDSGRMPLLSREHWIGVALTLAGLVLALLIAAVSVSVWISHGQQETISAIGEIRADQARDKAELSTTIAALAAKQAADEERLAAVDRESTEHYAEVVSFQDWVRASIATALSSLADLKVSLAQRSRGR
jgi:hypothetical protein